MEKFFNEDTLNLFSNKIYSILNYTLPGIFTLEVFFNKGLFSKPPENIFEFILFLIWAFLFSIPYNLIDSFNSENIIKHVKKDFQNQFPDNNELKDEFDKIITINEENITLINSLIQFISVIIYLLYTFFVFKYLTSHFTYNNIWGISKDVLIYLNTLIFYPICFLLTYLIGKIIEYLYARKMLKEIRA